MHKLSFSPLSLCATLVGVLAVSYVGLIAVIMSYGALTIEFSQSMKNDEAVVATLESQYLTLVSTLTRTDYVAEGYRVPVRQAFVREEGGTALR